MYRTIATFSAVLLSGNALALEDPTRPPQKAAKAQTVAKAARPSLQTILVGPDRRLAMIDDRVMAEGDRAGAIELLEVDDGAVVIRTGTGERLTLTLRSEKIFKEAK